MAEQGQTQLTPSGSSKCRVKRRSNSAYYRKINFRGREIIRNGVSKMTQNLLRDVRARKREGRRLLENFKNIKMDPSESMLVFLRTFNDELDKIHDHHISVND